VTPRLATTVRSHVTPSSDTSPGRARRATTAGGLLALLAASLLAGCAGAQRPDEAPPQADAAAAEGTVTAAEGTVTAPEGTVTAGREPEPAGAAAPEGAAATPTPFATPAAAATKGRPAPAPAAPAAKPKAVPEAEQRARSFFAEGVKLEAAGDLPGAVRAFERAAGASPDLAWASFNAGLLRERQGDDRGAVAAYERAIEGRPDFSPAGQNLARVWVRQGQLAEAEKELRARLAKADGVALRVGLAEVLLAAGNLDGAEAESRTALKVDEKNVGAMVVLATTYSRKKRFELARMVLENARQVDGADPAIWNRLGFVEMALGNRVQAIENFKVAAALRPDYPEAHANYGAMLADADDFAGAVQELELAVKYGPRSAGAWLDLGNAYRGLQQFEKAEQAYQKAQALAPGLVDVSFNLAVLYLDVEKPGLPTLQRLEQGVQFFDAFEKGGGVEPRVAAYRKDAAREIDREKKRLAREEKDRARKEAEVKRKAEEDARRLAEEEAARQEAEAKGKAAAERPAAPAPGVEGAPAPTTPSAAPPALPAPGKVGGERGDK
jgi:tetratricopeptide (TPR) repeat protein